MRDTESAPFARLVLWLVLGFVAVLIAWSALARLDIVAVAEGRLVPATYLKILQPAEGGVVKEILVREGESVRAGQVLMRMDAVLTESDLRSAAADHDARRIALRRIDAQLAGRPLPALPGDPPHVFARAQAQYAANRGAYESALDQERAALERARGELAVATEVRNKLRAVLPHYRQQEAAYEKLVRDGFAGTILYADKQRERIEKEQDLSAQEAAMLSARAAIAQSEKRLAQITADYRKQLQNERAEIAPLAERSAQDLKKHEHKHRLLELRATQDGVVKDLATHTIGTVASPGTILMTVVPRDEALRAEVWVRNDDIGFVRAGQRVRLKLAAFAFQKYGFVDGEVLRVSADAADPGADGQAAPRGRAASPLAYKTQVTLARQALDYGNQSFGLQSGMLVHAEIHLGTRTVLEYLLSPVQKAWHEAARER
ncbi:MAG: HlyD family type I secretion periplasmic adaptor subunit [Burkholderiales bacterium]|nr:HlyD family type I secretion periplasmic adaptor subunit [Burkholderiales bacterium]